MGFLDPLYHAVAWLLVQIHAGAAHVPFIGESAAWSVAVVLLTILMRLILFPIFVKQIRSQRAMQALQPKIKELQAKYKNDKEKLNTEMMALWRQEGVNPFAGCLPLLLQIPIFIALFHTLREIKPKTSTCNSHLIDCFPKDIAGFPQHDIFSAAHAKLFGIAPFSVSAKTSQAVVEALGGNQGATRVLCLVLIIVMAGTTFLTQRQMMARNGPMEGTAAQTQKIMLYIFPLSFFIYGFVFPIGVLLYWVTSNIFTMGQQFLVIHRMDAGAPASAPPSGPSGPAPGAKPKVPPRGPGQKPAQKPPAAPAPKPAADPTGSAKPSRSTADIVLPPGGAIGGLMGAPPTGGSPKPKPPNRPNPNRSKKKKRRGR